MRKLAVILLVFLSLVSCASAPPPVSFAEVTDQYASQITEQPERVSGAIVADCVDGICEVSEDTLSKIAKIINKLNDTVESLINSSNAKVSALTHCTYINHKKDEIIALVKTDAARSKLFAMGKQILSYVGCAAILGAGL